MNCLALVGLFIIVIILILRIMEYNPYTTEGIFLNEKNSDKIPYFS